MQQNATEKRLTKKQEQAAALLADGKPSDELIAKRLKINRTTLHRWKKLPAFQARIDEILAEVKRKLKERGVTEKLNRIESLDNRHRLLKRIIEARSVEHKDVPGGDTGLLICQVKFIKVYESDEGEAVADESVHPTRTSVQVKEYSVDFGLLREMREIEKQAAIELGEWTQKHEHSGTDGGPMPITIIEVVKPQGDLRAAS